MNTAEILAPVGGQAQLIAAVRAGCDAVYFGAKGFNARRNAENFSDLTEAVSYCHARGVKAYITLNTLVGNDEIAALDETLREICEAGADAVIVQDLAVARRARALCPDLKLHASTQMAVPNAAGVLQLEEMGFDRVVLARELSLNEIAAIRKKTHVELEAFVHGALCMSASGMCYLSSALGERSGNRGLCAQPCRLNFKANGREYALSLKDLSNLAHLKKMAQAGICSFKIEGRMRRPEYVASAVDACRKAANGEKYDESSLERMFSRAGFTDGYLTGKRTLDMFGRRREEDVANEKEYAQMRNLYRAEYRRVPVDMRFVAGWNKTTLTVTDGDAVITVTGNGVEPARTSPTGEERVKGSLAKTGDTPFYLNWVEIELPENAAVSLSDVNALRRDALDLLMEARLAPSPVAYEASPVEIPEYRPSSPLRIRARFERAEQMKGFPVDEVEHVILPLREVLLHPELRELPQLICELPAIIYPGDEERVAEMELPQVMCENIGAIRLMKGKGMRIFGGHCLNIFNALALEGYRELGVESATLSCELTMRDIASFGGTLERGIIGYGRLPLMRLRSCPVNRCSTCTGKNDIFDRRGTAFPLLCADKRFATLHNSVPLYVGDKKIDGVDFATLYFTVESARETRDVFHAFSDRASVPFDRTTGQYFRGVL